MIEFDSNSIKGKLHISEMSFDDNDMTFSWDYVERWTDEGEEGRFLGGVRESVHQSELKLSNIYFACWKRGKGILRISLNQEQLCQGKIIFQSWYDFLVARDIDISSIDLYFLVCGDDEKGCFTSYILGGDNKSGSFFGADNKKSVLLNKRSRAYVRQDFIAGTQDFVINIVTFDRYLRSLYREELAQKEILLIDFVDWDEAAIQFHLNEKELRKNKDFVPCKKLLFINEDNKQVFCHELTHNGSVYSFREAKDRINLCYDDVQDSFRFKVLFLDCSDGRSVVYELRKYGRIKKNTRYNKANTKEEQLLIDSLDGAKLSVMPYFTENRYFRCLVKDQFRAFNELYVGKVTNIGIKDSRLNIEIILPETEYKFKELSFVLRSDVIDRSYSFTIEQRLKGKNWIIKGSLDLDKIEWEQFYWDIKALVTKDGLDYELLLRNYGRVNKLKMLMKDLQYVLPGGEYLIFPYLTNSCGFAVTYRMRAPQDCRSFVRKEYLALFLYFLLAPYWKAKNIWLVYEKYSITAQDNSLYFFNYCMEKLPKKERKHIYYVIDKNAEDYKYVEKYGKKVIQFLSLKHMIYLRASKLLISSDTKAHAYAWHSPHSIYRYMIKWKRNVFLQHGVIYYKQCHRGLRKKGTNNCRLFIVSSDVEKKIIKDYFGYKSNEIAVTGLARWDVLHDTSVPGEKMILVMPTWRSWLEEATQEAFQKSDYYKNYMALLNNPKLHEFLEEKKVQLVFYIHPKFREYISAFSTSSPYIQMIEFGTQPLNQLLMKCNMMITDYSSACWDVYYQGKPVLFYLFDFELYNQVQGSYIDMRTEAFGEATDSMEELIGLMKKYEANGFKEEEKYALLRDELLPYRDDYNSERTYYLILKKFYRKKYNKLVEKYPEEFEKIFPPEEYIDYVDVNETEKEDVDSEIEG